MNPLNTTFSSDYQQNTINPGNSKKKRRETQTLTQAQNQAQNQPLSSSSFLTKTSKTRGIINRAIDGSTFDKSGLTILVNPKKNPPPTQRAFTLSINKESFQSTHVSSSIKLASNPKKNSLCSSDEEVIIKKNSEEIEKKLQEKSTTSSPLSPLSPTTTTSSSSSSPYVSPFPFSSLTSRFFHWVSENRGTSELPPFVYDDPIWNEAFQSTLKQIQAHPNSKHYYQRLFKCVFLLYLKKFLPKIQCIPLPSSSSTPSFSTVSKPMVEDDVSFSDTIYILDLLIQWYEQSHDLIATLMDAPDGYLMLSDMTKALAPIHRNHAKHFLDLAYTHAKTAFMLDPSRGHASAQLGWILLAQKDIPLALYFLLRATCSSQPASTVEVLHSYFRRILSPNPKLALENDPSSSSPSSSSSSSSSLPSASLVFSKLIGHLYTKTSLDETPSLVRSLQAPFPLSYIFIAMFLETLLRPHPHAHGFAMHFIWHCLWTSARAHAFLPLCVLSWHILHLPFASQDVPGHDQPLAVSAFVQLCDYLNSNPQDNDGDDDDEDLSSLPDFFALEGLSCWTSFPLSLSLSNLKAWWQESPCKGTWVHVSASNCFVATLGPSCTQRLVVTAEGGPPLVQMTDTLTYVLDTNTLLSHPIWDSSLPILVPLVVVMELRGLANSIHPRTAKYAKKTLEWLQSAHVPLYTSKGYRVNWAWEEAKQPSSADNLILETCSQLIQKSFRVMLVTEDINLRLKAQGWQIPVCQVGDVLPSQPFKERSKGRKGFQKGKNKGL